MLTGAAFFPLGCASAIVSKPIAKHRDVALEFHETPPPISGVYLGEVALEGGTFGRFLFSDVLIQHPSGVVELLIPIDSFERTAQFVERPDLDAADLKGKPASLFVNNAVQSWAPNHYRMGPPLSSLDVPEGSVPAFIWTRASTENTFATVRPLNEARAGFPTDMTDSRGIPYVDLESSIQKRKRKPGIAAVHSALYPAAWTYDTVIAANRWSVPSLQFTVHSSPSRLVPCALSTSLSLPSTSPLLSVLGFGSRGAARPRKAS